MSGAIGVGCANSVTCVGAARMPNSAVESLRLAKLHVVHAGDRPWPRLC